MLCWGVKLVKPNIALKCTNSALPSVLYSHVCLHVSRAMSHFPSKVQRNEGWLKTFTELYFLLTSVFGFIKQIAGFKRTTLRKRWHKLQILTGYLCLCRPRGSLPSDLATTFKPQNSQWGDNPKNMLVVLKCLQANIQTIWLELFIGEIVPISLLAFLLANSSSTVFVSTWK